MMDILLVILEVVWNPLDWVQLFVHDFETFVMECEGFEQPS